MDEEYEYSSTHTKDTTEEQRKYESDEIVAISVESYKFEEGRVKKHVVYVIQGQDSTGLFEKARRFKEFQSLRNILVTMWPACYIPKLPKKKAVVTQT